MKIHNLYTFIIVFTFSVQLISHDENLIGDRVQEPEICEPEKRPAPMLHQAAHYGLEVVVHDCLRRGDSVDARDESGSTPLHYAVLADRDDIVKFLLDHNADVNAADHNGVTPLHCAAFRGNYKMVKELLARGANLHAIATECQLSARDISIERNEHDIVALFDEASAAGR
jgi:hypothetical protein